MGYNLVITPRAQQRIEDLNDFLLNAWGQKCQDNFLCELDRCFYIIQRFPFAFKAHADYPDIRLCVVTPLNILYYKIVDNDVVILTLEDTRMNPQNIRF